MKIGDIEYTRIIDHVNLATTSIGTDVPFALGIKIRPLLVRTHVTMDLASVVTASGGVWFENGNAQADGASAVTLLENQLLHPIAYVQQGISTNGFTVKQWPWELLWWKILLPTVRIHAIGMATGDEATTTLHYRFVELTDDEIVEIAAQRAQA